MFDLTGKKALVTGSTQGIGKAIAKILLECGATVIVHGSSSMEKCKKVAEELHGDTMIAVADLSKPHCAESLYEQTGDVDILVLNASVQIKKDWDQITTDEIDFQLNTNFKASLKLIQAYYPAMQAKHWGRIVTIGSVQQYKPHAMMPVYAASKCAQMSMVRNFAKTFAPDGITINNVSPGVIATPRNDEALADEAYAQKVLANIPTGFVGVAEDCMMPVALLCSQESRYITGIDLTVDGGMSL